MKIEMGESLLYSWLRHIKECQIVQLNWKISDKWEMNLTNDLELLMKSIDDKFDSPFGKTNNLNSLLKQSEVDVIGFNFNNNTVYGVDVAFHSNGLGYSDNVKNVTKKIFRTLLTLDVYFDNSYNKEVIFCTPKINPKEYSKLTERISKINEFIQQNDIQTKIYLITNTDFESEILNPILHLSNDVSDTSELFLRSYQLTQMFDSMKIKKYDKKTEPEMTITSNEIKIGKLVKNTFQQLFNSNQLSDSEIINLMDKEYSKSVFDVNFPILKEIDNDVKKSIQRKINGVGNDRYYVYLFNDKYFLCNDWYERNRQKFQQWLLKIEEN